MIHSVSEERRPPVVRICSREKIFDELSEALPDVLPERGKIHQADFSPGRININLVGSQDKMVKVEQILLQPAEDIDQLIEKRGKTVSR